MLTIVVPTYNRQKDVLALVASIKKSDYQDFRIVIVNDASTDKTKETLGKAHPEVVVLSNQKNSGAAASRNLGIKNFINQTDYFLFLDSDEIIESNAISLLMSEINKNEEIAAATPSVYYFDQPGRKQYGEIAVGIYTGWNYSKPDKKTNEPWLVKSCGGNFLIKKEAIEKIGLFDEIFRVFYEDADFARRIIKAGYEIVYVPAAKVWHKTPILDKKIATKKWLAHAYLTARNKIIFVRKHSPCFLVFVLIYPVYLLFYIFKAAQFRDLKAFKEFCRGMCHGFKWAVKYKKPFG
ncbi:MAG: Glycosyl transferase family 2 [Candidatus Kuenenbacteria bacterium GW2011_GWA2_42_15]|uniref:Glycosyl transferase family 2 n=1 Tax=Candidatus Kuenenbacteria bacterium GW2011_GWA2_42_15 TaxID=1618677 RepID=A0A0G1BYB8_9BACT|nr:MAG: Glycosyl transferase family 2 [Candidatus Kuenenbacteria bacterium GW2011_GWA2_42_15]